VLYCVKIIFTLILLTSNAILVSSRFCFVYVCAVKSEMEFLNSTFIDFQSAEVAVYDYCRTNDHTIRVDVTEKFKSYNKKS